MARIRELEVTIRDLRSRPVQVREVSVLDAAARAQLDDLGRQLDTLIGSVQQLGSVITAALESTTSGTAASQPSHHRSPALSGSKRPSLCLLK